MHGFWNRLKAGWYHKGLGYSTFAKVAVPLILEKSGKAKTFLDVGAGCGTLSIPMAKAGKKVTAMDPSVAMIYYLKEDIKKIGLKRVTPVLSAWGGVKLQPHDVILCANVPQLLKSNRPFLDEAASLAKKALFFIESADPSADKFYYKELYPLLFNKQLDERTDYLQTYVMLHDMGIFANVEIIEYDFDQPFDDMAEALMFWKEYMGIVTGEHDAKLEGFLRTKLVKKGKILLAKFHKKAAVIWWKKG